MASLGLGLSSIEQTVELKQLETEVEVVHGPYLLATASALAQGLGYLNHGSGPGSSQRRHDYRYHAVWDRCSDSAKDVSVGGQLFSNSALTLSALASQPSTSSPSSLS